LAALTVVTVAAILRAFGHLDDAALVAVCTAAGALGR
jgi:hypothetical protein